MSILYVIGIISALLFYFLPTCIVLTYRNSDNFLGTKWGWMFVLNLFLGWTVIGWLILLYLAIR